VQVGSVERDVVEGSLLSVVSAEEDQEKDMDISLDMTAQDSVYDLEEVNEFLDQTFGKSVKLADYFDVDKFMRSAVMLQKTVRLDQLSEKKRFRLRKCITAVAAEKGGGKRGQVKRRLK
jgi:predicted nucleotidyltransferase